MAIKEILKMGNPLLRMPSRKITKEEFGSEELNNLLLDMRDTMEEAGGIGIAAPQIGELVQMAIVSFEVESDSEDEDEDEEAEAEYNEEIVINPKIEFLTEELSVNWEGCLSVPGLRGLVERPSAIRITYLDIDGNEKSVETDTFNAIVYQHEVDHLFGKLYVDRMSDIKDLVFEGEIPEEEE
ncbi:MAG: peptide deformylase [Thermoproteota archaeon]|jgi:peptide deformylase